MSLTHMHVLFFIELGIDTQLTKSMFPPLEGWPCLGSSLYHDHCILKSKFGCKEGSNPNIILPMQNVHLGLNNYEVCFILLVLFTGGLMCFHSISLFGFPYFKINFISSKAHNFGGRVSLKMTRSTFKVRCWTHATNLELPRGHVSCSGS